MESVRCVLPGAALARLHDTMAQPFREVNSGATERPATFQPESLTPRPAGKVSASPTGPLTPVIGNQSRLSVMGT